MATLTVVRHRTYARRRPPSGPTALYRLFDIDDDLLYVGISKYPWYRWTQHAAEKPWWPEVKGREFDWYITREEATEAEAQAIWLELPRYNIARPVSAEERVWLGAMRREPRLRSVAQSWYRGAEWSDVLGQLTRLVGPGSGLTDRAGGEISLDQCVDAFVEHLERSWPIPAEPYDVFLRSSDTLDVITRVLQARRPSGVP